MSDELTMLASEFDLIKMLAYFLHSVGIANGNNDVCNFFGSCIEMIVRAIFTVEVAMLVPLSFASEINDRRAIVAMARGTRCFLIIFFCYPKVQANSSLALMLSVSCTVISLASVNSTR